MLSDKQFLLFVKRPTVGNNDSQDLYTKLETLVNAPVNLIDVSCSGISHCKLPPNDLYRIAADLILGQLIDDMIDNLFVCKLPPYAMQPENVLLALTPTYAGQTQPNASL